jgi:hypothetical protein
MKTYPAKWVATPIRVVPRESRLSSLGDESFLVYGTGSSKLEVVGHESKGRINKRLRIALGE